MKNELTKFFASAPKGMTGLLARELITLGANTVQESGAGASFEGTLETAYRACLWSRIANRILLPLKNFQALTPESLYDGVRSIQWDKHLAPDGTLAVDCTAINSPITHTRYAALKVKDAVVDQFRERYGERPSVDIEHPDLRINVHLRNNQARLSLDLSGGSLHRRGYRAIGVEAPLKENLAAAILVLAAWPEAAQKGEALVDPMCGSGTLLIEGALIAADIAPGLYRHYFGFLGWLGHDRALWNTLINEAEEKKECGLKQLPVIRGYDANSRAVKAALENIARAGFSDSIHVEQQDLIVHQPELVDSKGLVIVNPPYGERIGDVNKLKSVYGSLGQLLLNLPGWHAAVFTGNPELAAYIGLRSQKSDTLYNGTIECKLFHYEIPEHSPETHRAPDIKQAISPGAEMFANRIKKNLKHLGRWASREKIDCYRLYDADLPEYALAIDLYPVLMPHHPSAAAADASNRTGRPPSSGLGEKLLVHIQEYQAPKSVDQDKAQQRLQEALAVIPQVLEIPVEQIFFKVRKRQKGIAQYEKTGMEGQYYQVREDNCRFLVNFSDYLDTGLFLDHRITRTIIQQIAKGRGFLNLFGYTGTATVHAAVGGATNTTTVDMSKTYLNWAQRNLQLNGFTGKQHELIHADCLEWLEKEARQSKPTRHYGLIFVDPPTFSNSKRMEGTFDVQRDHVMLIQDVARLLEPNGIILFSNNYRKFKLDTEAFHKTLKGFRVEDITRSTIPKDFERHPGIHHCWKIVKM